MGSEWYVRKGGKEHGPFSSQQLKQLASAAKIAPQTEVRLGVDGRWVTAGKVQGLFQAAAGTAKSAPPAVVERSRQLPANRAPGNVPVERAIKPELLHAAEARRPCPYCGEPIAVEALKCRFCNEYLDGRARPAAQPMVVQPAPTPAPAAAPQVNVVVNQQTNVGFGGPAYKRWSRLVAMLLSLLIPGAGQFYKGQPLNAIVWFVLVVVGYIPFIIPGVLLHICCIIGAGMGNPYR